MTQPVPLLCHAELSAVVFRSMTPMSVGPFFMLFALAGDEQRRYAIMQAAKTRWPARFRWSAKLCTTIGKLLDAGLIEGPVPIVGSGPRASCDDSSIWVSAFLGWYLSIMAEKPDEAKVLAEAQEDADFYTASFMEQLPAVVKKRRQTDRGFRSRLEKRWRRPLQLFEGVWLLGLQLGSEFNQEERREAEHQKSFVFSALTRLHARSCLICTEVLALLKAGHASGAYGRWRTLHETAITAWFISNGDALLAQKYLAHRTVKDLEDAEQYQKDCVEIGSEPIPENTMKVLRQECDQLKKIYGDSFTGGYGWAADAIRAKIPELKGKSITFNHLEQAAEQGHMRSYYRFASHSIHPTSKGLRHDIGLIRQGEVLLSGPSNYGLAEPAIASCVSLQSATGALLMTKPNRQRIASLMALQEMIHGTSAAFREAEQRIVKEDSEVPTSSKALSTARIGKRWTDRYQRVV